MDYGEPHGKSEVALGTSDFCKRMVYKLPDLGKQKREKGWKINFYLKVFNHALLKDCPFIGELALATRCWSKRPIQQ